MNKLLQSAGSVPCRFKHGSKLGLKPGFALIATVSTMILLVMLAFAMLSLSSVEQRSSKNSRAMAEAQANARMALLLAIGELQQQMGPDQRISANADIFSLDATGASVTVANPHYMGAWDSYRYS
ncbi:MAG: hypothetical protein ACI9E1_001198 [Cryomorphaceae bacterium]|jgi:hypothetical protein